MKLFYIMSIFLLAVSLILTGCSSKDDNNDNITDTDIIIGPHGGYFWVDTVLIFYIPRGALSENVEFTLAWTTSPAPIGGNAVFVSAPITIGPAGTNFALPATIRLNYNEDYLRGGNEADIKVYTDLGAGWIPLTTTVDIDSNIASAMVNHLSDFVTAVDTPTTTEVSYITAYSMHSTKFYLR